MGCAAGDATALLDRLLSFNPSSRMSVAEALRHPFMRPLVEAGGADWDWQSGGEERGGASAAAASAVIADTAPPFEHDERVECGDESTLRMLLFAECGFGEMGYAGAPPPAAAPAGASEQHTASE